MFTSAMHPPHLDLETLNAEWKAKEDGKSKGYPPPSPTGTDSTEEPPSKSIGGSSTAPNFNFKATNSKISTHDSLSKKKKMIFGGLNK